MGNRSNLLPAISLGRQKGGNVGSRGIVWLFILLGFILEKLCRKKFDKILLWKVKIKNQILSIKKF